MLCIAFAETALVSLKDPGDPAFIREFQESTLARPLPKPVLDRIKAESLKCRHGSGRRLGPACWGRILRRSYAASLRRPCWSGATGTRWHRELSRRSFCIRSRTPGLLSLRVQAMGRTRGQIGFGALVAPVVGATVGATVWPLITIMAICALLALASFGLVVERRRSSPAPKL